MSNKINFAVSLILIIGCLVSSIFVWLPLDGTQLVTLDFTNLRPQAMYDPLYMVDPLSRDIKLSDTTLCDEYKIFLRAFEGKRITNGQSAHYDLDQNPHNYTLYKAIFAESSVIRFNHKFMTITNESAIKLPISRDAMKIVDEHTQTIVHCVRTITAFHSVVLFMIASAFIIYMTHDEEEYDLEWLDIVVAKLSIGILIVSFLFAVTGICLTVGVQVYLTGAFNNQINWFGIEATLGSGALFCWGTLVAAPLVVLMFMMHVILKTSEFF